MADREKVIKAWEIFRDSNPYEICSGREFLAIREPEYCMGQMIEDTIALLKEQEAIKPEWYDGTPFCGNCGHRLEKKNRNMKEIKCPTCGKTVKWE